MTTDNIHSYQPTNGHGLPHDPIPAILGPRPIGWISTHDGQGNLNLAPYSFFNIFNYGDALRDGLVRQHIARFNRPRGRSADPRLCNPYFRSWAASVRSIEA